MASIRFVSQRDKCQAGGYEGMRPEKVIPQVRFAPKDALMNGTGRELVYTHMDERWEGCEMTFAWSAVPDPTIRGCLDTERRPARPRFVSGYDEQNKTNYMLIIRSLLTGFQTRHEKTRNYCANHVRFNSKLRWSRETRKTPNSHSRERNPISVV